MKLKILAATALMALFATAANADVVKVGGTGAAPPNAGNIFLTSAGTSQASGNGAYNNNPTVVNGQAIASDWVWSFVNGVRTTAATYTFTFDLTGFNLTSAVFEGLWGVDNFGTISLNGNAISSLQGNGGVNFSTLTSFSTGVDAFFVAGLNTVTFALTDGGPPAAFRAAVRVTADPNSNVVPLPAALPLFLAGLAGVGFAGRRRRAI